MFRTSLLCLTLGWVGCGSKEKTDTTAPEPQEEVEVVFDPMSIELADPDLIEGRTIWMETCAVCHLEGLGGAPIIGNTEAWSPRIAQGMDVLFTHALEGFYGKVGEMPAKGGNDALSEDQVKLAVRFVVSASQ